MKHISLYLGRQFAPMFHASDAERSHSYKRTRQAQSFPTARAETA